jgi:DNA-binding MarR family transcriptional regulator
MSNVPAAAPDIGEIASDLRYLIGELARRTRERDIVTLPTRLAETLSYLDREGPMTTSELAERHSVRQQSMAATLGELDVVGYLERQPHPTDRRKILVAISQDGRERLNDDRRRRAAWLAEAIADKLTPREHGALANTLPLLDRLLEG